MRNLLNNFFQNKKKSKSEDDWRIETSFQISEIDGNIAAGLTAYKVTLSQNDDEAVTFISPSPIALYFNISLRNLELSLTTRKKIKYSEEKQSGEKKWRTVDIKCLNDLYDYYEQSMITIITSFQAIEYYCNSIISHAKLQNFEIVWRKKKLYMNSLEMQKDLSIAEKIEKVLPTIFQIESFDKKILETLEEVKEFRNRIIHLKEHDVYVRNEKGYDKFSIFYEFSKMDLKKYVSDALSIIEYFCKFDKSIPPWIVIIRKKIDQIK